jgi:hypothetical protein
MYTHVSNLTAHHSDLDFNLDQIEQAVASCLTSMSDDTYTASSGTSIKAICRCS